MRKKSVTSKMRLGMSSPCCGRRSCGLAACPDCSSAWRQQFRKRLRRLLSDYPSVAYTTVILPDPGLRQKKLKRINPKAVVQQFRMMLRRFDLGDLTIVGIFEADWNEITGCWEPHLHLFILDRLNRKELSERLDVLRKHLLRQDPHRGDSDKQVYRPILTEFLTTKGDKKRVVGYVTKMRPMRKRPYFAKGKRRYLKAHLRGKHKRAAEAWLSRPPRDFVFLQNLRLDAAGFRRLRLLSGNSSITTE